MTRIPISYARLQWRRIASARLSVRCHQFQRPIGSGGSFIKNGDATVNGTALQLTPDAGGRAGIAVYNQSFSSNLGLSVQFTYNYSSGSGADGISFFRLNGDAVTNASSVTPDRPADAGTAPPGRADHRCARAHAGRPEGGPRGPGAPGRPTPGQGGQELRGQYRADDLDPRRVAGLSMGFLGRVFASCVMLVVASIVLFALVRAIPVSPARVVLGPDATEADIVQFDHDHGLDLLLATQYLHWVGGMTRGDFSRSYADGSPIGPRIAANFPITMELVVFGFLFALSVAIPLGIVSAYWEGRWIDHVARLIAVIGVSVPGVWLGLMLNGWFAVSLRWLPPGGYVPPSDGMAAHLRAMVLPTIASASTTWRSSAG